MNPLSWSTIALMVFLSSNISPRTSAVTFLLRSPSATAPMTRCISSVGRTRSPIMLFADTAAPRVEVVVPVWGRSSEREPLRQLALLADDLAHARELGPELLFTD